MDSSMLPRPNGQDLPSSSRSMAAGGFRAEDVALAAARADCACCRGYGQVPSYGGRQGICNCVWRAVFRACLARYRAEQMRMQGCTTARWELLYPGRRGHPGLNVGNRSAEYCAEIWLAVRRNLSPLEKRIFERNLLAQVPYRTCGTGLAHGAFFCRARRIQERMGREFMRRGLYPTNSYFGAGYYLRSGYGLAHLGNFACTY
jgi:hypothetical protein